MLEFLQGILNAITVLGSSIVNGLIDALKSLFIPRADYFSTVFKELYDSLVAKLPFIEDVKNISQSFIGSLYGSTDRVPQFNFNYLGMTLNIFDFSLFAPYRMLVHSVVLFTSYYFYIRKLLKRIPGIIGGFT